MRQSSAKQVQPAKANAVTPASARMPTPGSALAHDPSRTAALPVGFDFGRIAVHGRTPARIQPKLTIGASEDALEREADRAAEDVMRPQNAPAPVQAVHAPVLQRRTAHRMATRPVGVPLIVHDVLRSPGQPLDPATRAFMEPRFGHDFSKVRVHADARAAQSAQAINARAYTAGREVVFGAGQHSPDTSGGMRLLAHELTHVVQQGAAGLHRVADGGLEDATPQEPVIQRKEGDDPLDAGVPETLPGGVPDDPKDKVPDDPKDRQPSQLADQELGPEYERAIAANDSVRADAIDHEIEKRLVIWPMAAVRGPAPVTGGAGMVTPEVALEILNNMSKGQPPFKPELGLGGCSWFTTEGTPYTSVKPNQTVSVQVEIAKGSNPLVFREADLLKIYEAEAGAAALETEAQVRAQFKLSAVAKLTSRAARALKYRIPGTQEKMMWTRVGEKIAASSQKIGEIVLEPGSQFSRPPGKFAAVADAGKISLKGGTAPLVEAVAKSGASAEPVVVEAAEALAKRMKWAGRVRNVFRYGGRVMIVVAITADLIKIYYAQDRKKAVVESVGGWAGATAAGAAFAAWWTPADVAGPWAWAGHGVGTLIAGGIGYWVGSATTRTIYELVAE